MAAATADPDAVARSAAGAISRAAAGERAATAPAPTGVTATTGAAWRGCVTTINTNTWAEAGGMDAATALTATDASRGVGKRQGRDAE